jgi:hypothetical protein
MNKLLGRVQAVASFQPRPISQVVNGSLVVYCVLEIAVLTKTDQEIRRYHIVAGQSFESNAEPTGLCRYQVVVPIEQTEKQI